MEKAILKTLIYADIFNYPLKINEIHKWLVGKKVNLQQVDKALRNLYQASSIKYKGKYYFLPRRERIVLQRFYKEKQSLIYFKKAKIISRVLKLIPWIKLVGISGGLAMGNTSKKDDIDLFIIIEKNRLWISRLFILGILSLMGQRRKRQDKGRIIAGKLCTNIFLEEDELEQENKDIYTAHEVLQMKVLWERDGIYQKYLESNSWTIKFLPNWIGSAKYVSSSKYYLLKGRNKEESPYNTKYRIDNTFNIFEKLARELQLKIMGQPKGMERIEDGALYFHPEDYRERVLREYKYMIKKI